MLDFIATLMELYPNMYLNTSPAGLPSSRLQIITSSPNYTFRDNYEDTRFQISTFAATASGALSEASNIEVSIDNISSSGYVMTRNLSYGPTQDNETRSWQMVIDYTAKKL